jgi:Bacterial Ig-like domain (group 3)/MBG domain (YGX type)/Right handed beta helix region
LLLAGAERPGMVIGHYKLTREESSMASRHRLEQRVALAFRADHHHRLRRRPVLEVLEGRALLATFTVNNLGDAGIGSNDAGDLRYCINQANANDQANSIVFNANVFSTPQTITLSGSQLELSDTGGTQTITGPAAGVTVNGSGSNGGSRVFQVDSGVTASISGLTISGGRTIYPNPGAGLANYGTATLTGCTISGNVSYGYGGSGGVFNSSAANLMMSSCIVSDNAGYDGGGLANDGTATLIDCTVSGNYATHIGEGGGVLNYGSTANLTVTDCTVSDNSAYLGGGISNYWGTATLADCTLSGNSASDGGGIDNGGTATLTDCTVSGNSANYGGGLANSGTATLTDTIVAGNIDRSGASDIGGVDVSGSNNLIGPGGSGGLTNGVDGNIVLTSLTDLDLAPLGNYGGPTQTMALLAGSAAIGAGVIADYPGTTTPITTDQRGLPLDSPNPDIGAFQTQGSTLTPLFFSGISNQTITYGTPSVTISGTLANGSQAPVGETVAVTLNGDEQSATIGSEGAFSTTFDITLLDVVNSPYTITYVYTGDATFAPAGTTSTLTVIPAALTTFTVNSVGDAGIGSGDSGDLRYCINLANTDDGANLIVFDSTVFSTPQTIALSGKELELKDTGGTQTITGPAAGVTISGAGTSSGFFGGSSRVFEVAGGVTASISGLTISGGSTYTYPGVAPGGGLLNFGGTVTLTGCTLTGNYAYSGAGGLVNAAGGTVTLTDCTLSGNSSVGGAGGLMSYGGRTTLTDCTLSGNYGGTAGGLENFGGLATLTDCTVSGNTCNRSGGAGMFNYSGTATLTGCTISGNYGVEYSYGGLANTPSYNAPVGPATLIDTIVAGNSNGFGPSDIVGFDVSGRDNLIGTGGSGGRLVNGTNGNIVGVANPLLSPLGNYGGPTQTMALLPGSPALGAGIAVTGVTTDQRGEPLDSPNPDMGAFQSQGFTLTPVAGSTPQSTTAGTAFANPLAVIVAANDPVEPVAGGVLTFAPSAGGIFVTISATTATIGSNGIASVTAKAKPTAGSYTVTASTDGGHATADFALTNTESSLISLTFSGISNQTITDGTSRVTVSGTLADGSQAPVGESIAVTLGGVQRSATIGTGGAFSTTFDTASLTVVNSPYTITYVYAGDATFASAGTTSMLTVKPTTLTTIFTVNSLLDAGIGSGDSGDLRYCINQANADGGANQIVFGPTIFSTPQTITLSGSPLELEDTGGTQTITGPAAGVTISGAGNSRVFQVDSGVTASISGLTISGGSIGYGSGAGLANYGTATLADCTLSGNSGSPYSGAAGEFNSSTANLTMTDCTVSGNSGFGTGGLANSGTANLTDCTINGNYAPYNGGVSNYSSTANLIMTGCTVSGNTSNEYGGGVFNSGTATLIDCTLSDNSGGTSTFFGGEGGGLANDGTATLTDCTVSGNSADGGGGIDNGGTATLTDCTLSDNSATTGGGLANGYGLAVLTGCTISGNTSGDSGGGVFNLGTVNLTDCTVSDNSAGTLGGPYSGGSGADNGGGGGVYNYGTAALTDCTLSGNTAASAAGMIDAYHGAAVLTNTIVAGNIGPSGASDIGGTKVSGSNNLIGTGGSGGLTNGVDGNIVLTSLANLDLAPLANNGGPTQTMALLPGSPAIGAGVIADYPGTTTPITTDQRDEPLDAPNPDIGAFQTQVATLITLNFSGINDQSITYGTSSVAISGKLANGSQAPVGETVAVSLDGDVQSATIGSGGEFSTTFDTTDFSVAGSPDAITYAYTSDGTFASASTTSTLTVNPATLTLTADPETKVYGTADPALDFAATGFKFSDNAAAVLTGALARADAGILGGEQVGDYAITQGTLAADSNYTISFVGDTLAVTPAPLTVAASPQTKVYGTADAALTDTLTGFIDATVDGVPIDDTAATALMGALARAQSGTLAGERAGGYAITQGTLATDSNYALHFNGNTLTITPAPLTVTANPVTKVYGTSDPSLTDGVTGLVDVTVDGVTIDDTVATVVTGALARAHSRTRAGEQVGDYAITQGTLAAGNNYTIAFTGAALAITPAPLTVTANAQTEVYGAADPTFTVATTGLVDATVDGVTIDDLAASVLSGSLTRAQSGTLAGEQVGDYAITQGSLAADSNYTMSFNGGTLGITPATLSVVANPETKVYGTDDPGLTATATGLVDATVDGVAIDDTEATVLTGAPARAQSGTPAGEQVGDYAISQGTLAVDSNYTIAFTAGALTITPATLTVTAAPETKALGSADPALTYTAAGFQFDDTAATVLSGHLVRAAGETVAGGPYAITQGTLAADGNYTIQFTGSALTITLATPRVTVSAPGETYTGAPIVAQATVTGVSGTAAASLDGVTPILTYYVGSGTSGTNLGSAAPSAAGNYTVVASFPGSADYAAAQSEPAAFAIAPAAATIVLTTSSSLPVYGQAVTIVAAVKSSAGAPGGTVTFFDDGSPLGTVALTDSGQAALSVSSLALGSHAITATYNGAVSFLVTSSSPTSESVSPAATAIVLVPRPVVKGKKTLKAIELTAKIEPAVPGGGVPTGHVIFELIKRHGKKTHATTLGTAALSGGAATLTFKPKKVLNETLTIVYSGDPDFLASNTTPSKLTKTAIASSRI